MTPKQHVHMWLQHFRSWGPVNSVIITIAGFIISQIFGVIIISSYALLRGWNSVTAVSKLESSVWMTFAFSLIVYGFYIWIIRAFLHWCGHRLKEVGLRLTKNLLEIPYYVFGGFVVYFIMTLVTSSIVKQLIPSVNLDQRQELGFSSATSGWSLLPVFLSLVIIPPIAEEIVCRGFLYTGLRKKLTIFISGVITSIIFAMAHLQWGNDAPLLWAAAIDTFVLSAVLIYVREKTDSLVPPIGIHMLKNLIAFIALFILRVA